MHFYSGVDIRFFTDERKAGSGLILSSDLQQLAARSASDLDDEVESRWRLVETAWALSLPTHLIRIDPDHGLENLLVPGAGRRKNITSVRGALNGYQRGQCFYCSREISLMPGDPDLAQVDHFFPHVLTRLVPGCAHQIDTVWNLVLACAPCNGSVNGGWIPGHRGGVIAGQ